MAQTQPFALACQGGLNRVSSQFELYRTPGEALKLQNFELFVSELSKYSIIKNEKLETCKYIKQNKTGPKKV